MMNSKERKMAQAMVNRYRKAGIRLFQSDVNWLAKNNIWAFDLLVK